ncbi:hypothetical protein G7Y79_00077g099780 [Physcia stellaris]|nr:hypothetical protein G7Y79_00077g099780 [Physcia stellaris]
MRFVTKSVLVLCTLALSLVTAAQQAQSVPQNSSADHARLPVVSGTCTSNCNHSATTLIPSNTRSIPGFNAAKTDLPTSCKSEQPGQQPYQHLTFSPAAPRSSRSTSASPTEGIVAKGFGKAKTVTKYLTATVYRAPTVTVTKTPSTVYKTKTKTKTVSVVNGTAAATEYSVATNGGWSIGDAGLCFGGLAGVQVALVMIVFM